MIIAQMATIPSRELTVRIAAKSLENQVDIVRVFRDSPSDGYKFKRLTEFSNDEIIFICDDDIEYPADYVTTMMKYLRPGIVITCMGKIMKPRPIESFYRDELIGYKTFDDIDYLRKVEVPGTGSMAFHRSTCPNLDHEYFKIKNCADIWMAIYCKENNIPVFVIPHRANWLINLMPILPLDTPNIFDSLKNDDGEITELINDRL